MKSENQVTTGKDEVIGDPATCLKGYVGTITKMAVTDS